MIEAHRLKGNADTLPDRDGWEYYHSELCD